MPDDDRVASTLAGIRERSAAALEFPASGFAENSIRCCAQSAMDVPLLLAAIEAALKAADGWKYIHSARCARELRAAITAELTGTGKEGSDG